MSKAKNYRGKPPRKRNDELLKAIFEDNFIDFLIFLYPNAADIFDFDRGIVFMDKELLEITAQRDPVQGVKIADLLVKIYLKNGKEKWILVHTEVEAGDDQNFGYRMFQYHYRIMDRYDVQVESIAVFIGDNTQTRPSSYKFEGITSDITFNYRTYHIFDHNEEELLAMDNIFAYIVLACQKALLEGKVADEEVTLHRMTIIKSLYATQKYSKERIFKFLLFLKNIIFIENKEENRIFDSYIYQVTGGTINMGVIEVVKKQERQAGITLGIAKGKAEGRAKFVENLITQLNLPEETIAQAAEVSLDFVQEIKKKIEARKK